MTPLSFGGLHLGPALEVTLLDYLARVVLSLCAFGGVAALVWRGLDVIESVRAQHVDASDGGEPDV